MYNIDLYSYWKKPFAQSKKYAIHPLDDEGKEQYYSKESHNVHYLKRTDPFVFKSILGVDYDTLVRQQKEDIANINQLKSPLVKDQQELNKKDEVQKCPDNEIQTGVHINKFEENKKNEVKEGDNHVNDNYNNNMNFYHDLKRHKSSSAANIRPYTKERTFKDIYGYDNITSFKSNGERYSYAIKNMKQGNIAKPPLASKRYDGFTVFDAPIIKRIKSPSSLFKCYNDKMGHTLKCLNNSSGIRKAMNEEEMRNNLFNQTSRPFLRQHHLPDIIKIADSRQVIRKQKIGFSKELGERYNPYSLIAPSKNRTGRNYIGDLFKH
jgi:hypothetical protein